MTERPVDAEARAGVLDKLISAGQDLHDRVGPDNLRESVSAMEIWDREVKTEAQWIFTTAGNLTSYPTYFERGYYLNGTTADVNVARVKRELSTRLNALLSARHSLDVARTAPPALIPSRKIFIIHGRSEANQKVARFLNEATDATAVILGEQPRGSQVIIEALEEFADSVSFAIALLTGDDVGGLAGSRTSKKRARQNVIFELGFFIAALGRAQVQILYEDGVELPSDIIGALYTRLDSDGAWKMSLGRRLRQAGFTVDLLA